MKKALRYIALSLAGLGLLLFGAVWAASLSHEARWHDTKTSIFIRRGALHIEILPPGTAMDPGNGWHVDPLTYQYPLMWWRSYRKGYVLASTINGMSVSWRTIFPTEIVVPVWPVPAACMAIILLLALTHRKHKPNHCRRCGYDLTGNVSGICSECGEPV
jgi:hypothetical protein